MEYNSNSRSLSITLDTTFSVPFVSVPVLSKAIASTSDIFSKEAPDLIKIPFLDKVEIAATVTGVALAASAHGDTAIK
ncbi:Uncharacterised protein [Chlamydia trachomatis]|nr:Uncharacterised protein [Chlamydia trachomatis]